MTARLTRERLRAMLRTEAAGVLVERGDAFFLVDPSWGERELAQWRALAERQPTNWDGDRGWLCVPTGGSSGAMKLARHDEYTLGAAAEGFCRHFGVNKAAAIGMLPLWHVSGLMARVRALTTGAEYQAASWKAIERGERPPLPDGGESFVSLVPTQLARLLGDPSAEAWLRGFRAVLLGGGAARPEMLVRARAAGLPLAPGYGMTETAAMIAARRPEEFLNDASEHVGSALPHGRIRADADGRLWVEGASLFAGYWPDTRAAGEWRTDDLGEILPAGSVRVLGRADALINTGGEKVNPAEVEDALRETLGFSDAAVIGMPDAEWGECVVALVPLAIGMTPPNLMTVRAALAGRLAPAKLPRRLVLVPAAEWPRDERGKLRRAELSRLAAAR